MYIGTEVGLVRAQGLPQETVLYGLEEEREEWEGAFEIDTISGEITVGPNGSNILVIVRTPDIHWKKNHYFTITITLERGTIVHHLPSVCLL